MLLYLPKQSKFENEFMEDHNVREDNAPGVAI